MHEARELAPRDFVRHAAARDDVAAPHLAPLGRTPALRVILEGRQELTRRCERAQARIIPLVFHRSGRPIHSFRRSWKKACEKAGRPGLLFHDLRRSAVRNLERAGVPRSVAMKLTGHKTESIYRRYAIVAESDLRAAGEKLTAATQSGQGLQDRGPGNA